MNSNVRKIWRFINFFLFINFLLVKTHILYAQSNQQQIFAGELPDPSVVKVDGNYYMAGSSNNWGPFYPIYQSKELTNWEFVNYVFNEAPPWTTSSYWAPELFYHNDTFYCYYTAKREDGISVIGVATTKDISKGFQDHGHIIEWGDEAIDAFVFKEKEKLYITWKAYGLTKDKPIQILGSELTEDGLSLKGEVFEMLSAEAESWEEGGIEGQSIIRRNKYLYMFYSGNACCGKDCNYQVGVARAKSMKGPWEKYSGNPVITSTDEWKCPGHGSVINSGRDWNYLYHAYDSEGFPYLGRTVVMSKFKWNSKKWPDFLNAGEKMSDVYVQNFEDDFESGINEHWRFDVENVDFHLSTVDGHLYLRDDGNSREKLTGAVIAVDPLKDDFVFSTKIIFESSVLKGLTLYVKDDRSIGVGVQDQTVTYWEVADNKHSILVEADLERGDNIYLKAIVEDAFIAKFYYSYDGKKWLSIKDTHNKTLEIKGEQLAWWSWGVKAGLFTKGSREETDNEAVFENFELNYEKQVPQE